MGRVGQHVIGAPTIITLCYGQSYGQAVLAAREAMARWKWNGPKWQRDWARKRRARKRLRGRR